MSAPKELHEKSQIAIYQRNSSEEANKDDAFGQHQMYMVDLPSFAYLRTQRGSKKSVSRGKYRKRPVFTELLGRVEDKEFDTT